MYTHTNPLLAVLTVVPALVFSCPPLVEVCLGLMKRMLYGGEVTASVGIFLVRMLERDHKTTPLWLIGSS